MAGYKAAENEYDEADFQRSIAAKKYIFTFCYTDPKQRNHETMLCNSNTWLKVYNNGI